MIRAAAALVAGALAAWPAAAAARPRVVAFACQVIGGRTRVLVPRAAEDARGDDELRCWANLDGLPRDGRATVAAELRVHAPGGRVRTVASGLFESSRDRPGRAWIAEIIVPHWTWASAIDWRPARPVLRLSLVASAKAGAGKRSRWRPIADARFEMR